MKLLLQIILLYGDSKKSASQNRKLLQSTIYDIYFQQNDLMNRCSKGHTYMHDLYIVFYISCFMTTCYMWCANEIYYHQAELFEVFIHYVTKIGDVIGALFVPCYL